MKKINFIAIFIFFIILFITAQLLILAAENAATAEPAEDNQMIEAPAVEASVPKSGDPALMMGAIALLSAGGFTILKNKRK